MFFHDYIITFGQEVELFWRAKVSGGTVIFFSSRYLCLIVTIYTMMINFNMSNAYLSTASCVAVQKSNFVLYLLLYVPWAAFSALRAHALCRNRPVTVSVLLLAMGTVVVNFVMLPYIAGENDPATGCTGADTLTFSMARTILSATIVSRTCQMASDALVVLVAWFSESTATRTRRIRWISPVFLADIMVRDGITLLVLNSLQLTFTLISVSTTIPLLILTFSHSLTSILVCRCLLNLQASNMKTTCDLDRDNFDEGSYPSFPDYGSLTFRQTAGYLDSSDEISNTVGGERVEITEDITCSKNLEVTSHG
ncbi:hypothetical protein C8Q80DRAFT_1206965 [Daedaleopsis nitida]|nr:hypothetical protein C8Q80DRAFT_1206965 [Daedaleopsis nitida]